MGSAVDRSRYLLLAGCLALFAAGGGASVARAAEDGGTVPADAAAPFVVRGFATLGLARFSNPDVGVVSAFDQRKPVFDSWSADLDSVAGAQMQWNMGERDHLLVQAVARAGTGWRVVPSLVFWQHRWDGGVRLRLGRIGSPIFRDSDIHHIGYASKTVRPALPVYAKINAFSSLDGGELAWQTGIGELSAEVSLHAGASGYRHRVYREGISDLDVDIRDMHGFTTSLRYDNWSARLGRTVVGRFSARSPVSDMLDSAIDVQAAALRGMGRASQGKAIEGYHSSDGNAPNYTSFALGWASSDWHVDGEGTRAEYDSPTIGKHSAWQFTIARAFGPLMPYVFTARQTVRQPQLVEAAFAATGISAQLDGGLAATREGVIASRRDGDLTMRSVGVGVRYDYREGVAFKLQAERIHYGSRVTASPGISRAEGGASGTLVSATVELAF